MLNITLISKLAHKILMTIMASNKLRLITFFVISLTVPGPDLEDEYTFFKLFFITYHVHSNIHK